MWRILTALLACFAYPVAACGEVQPLNSIRADIFDDAETALKTHADKITNQNTIVVVDFRLHSAKRRLHIVNLETQSVQSLHVSHGRGSDPNHDGLLDHFSSKPGSFATPEGAHITAEQYVGKHGKSVRMDGLESGNHSARRRAIVIHAAEYAEPKMLNTHGKLGRSHGCLAFSKRDLDTFLRTVPKGTLIYISK